MSKFQVGKSYGYKAFPNVCGTANGFLIKQKIGKYLIATCGGDYDYATHVFDADTGVHLSDNYGNTRSEWTLLLTPPKKVEYKVVRVDGTTTDWVVATNTVAFSSTTVGGFVRVNGGTPVWRASRITLKDEINSHLS